MLFTDLQVKFDVDYSKVLSTDDKQNEYTNLQHLNIISQTVMLFTDLQVKFDVDYSKVLSAEYKQNLYTNLWHLNIVVLVHFTNCNVIH